MTNSKNIDDLIDYLLLLYEMFKTFLIHLEKVVFFGGGGEEYA